MALDTELSDEAVVRAAWGEIKVDLRRVLERHRRLQEAAGYVRTGDWLCLSALVELTGNWMDDLIAENPEAQPLCERLLQQLKLHLAPSPARPH
jgi:hypothetical protein